MAGGQGTRFWPVSRSTHPKQFLVVGSGGRSLIQQAADRVAKISPQSEIVVVTNKAHEPLVKKHLPEAQMICEPIGRNTAASILLAALKLEKESSDAVMIVLSADHAIRDTALFVDLLEEAAGHAAAHDDLVVLGITPLSPHTGYGYIREGAPLTGRVCKVSSFVEKPNIDRAREYLASGEYYWNSGMFIWRVGVFLDAVRRFMPKLWEFAQAIKPFVGSDAFERELGARFPALDSIAVDVGILERADNCAMVRTPDFGWSDVGSWDAWAEHYDKDSAGNVLRGPTVSIASKDSIVLADKRLVALVGVENLIVVDAGDALLVCSKDRSQDVKKVVEQLAQKGMKELL